MGNSNWRIISSTKNWIESASIEQLKHAAAMRNVIYAAGMPDLHPGKGIPVGAAVLTQQTIYPHIIGNDIGCGMGFYATSIDAARFKAERYAKIMDNYESFEQIDIGSRIAELPQDLTGPVPGTIGGGNHFAELQAVEEIFDSEAAAQCGINKESLYILVHSGSRGLGDSTLRRFIEKYQAQNGLEDSTESFREYMAEHDYCVRWGIINRDIIACRLLTGLGLKPDYRTILDTPHNFIEKISENGEIRYIHRKGVAKSEDFNIIPGSRGTFTYLVKKTHSTVDNLYSVPHGAGRKWERSACKGKLGSKYTKETIKITKFGSRIICKDKDLLFEEAPESYKNIETVVNDITEAGIATPVATFRPVMTLKY